MDARGGGRGTEKGGEADSPPSGDPDVAGSPGLTTLRP